MPGLKTYMVIQSFIAKLVIFMQFRIREVFYQRTSDSYYNRDILFSFMLSLWMLDIHLQISNVFLLSVPLKVGEDLQMHCTS